MECSPCTVTRNPFTGAEAPAVDVKVDKMSVSYDGIEVIKDLSFSVAPGEIFVLMGPSGSGKSVLLRQVAGLESPTSGAATVDGRDAFAKATREQLRLALVFQAGA